MLTARRALVFTILRTLAPDALASVLAALIAWAHALDAARNLLRARPRGAASHAAFALAESASCDLTVRAFAAGAEPHVNALAAVWFFGCVTDVGRLFEPRDRPDGNRSGATLAEGLDLDVALADLGAARVALLPPYMAEALADLGAIMAEDLGHVLGCLDGPLAFEVLSMNLDEARWSLDEARARAA